MSHTAIFHRGNSFGALGTTLTEAGKKKEDVFLEYCEPTHAKSEEIFTPGWGAFELQLTTGLELMSKKRLRCKNAGRE